MIIDAYGDWFVWKCMIWEVSIYSINNDYKHDKVQYLIGKCLCKILYNMTKTLTKFFIRYLL